MPMKLRPGSKTFQIVRTHYTSGACPGGGGPRGLPPPLEIKKKVIRANFKLFHLYFATFLVENIIFYLFSELGPPPEKLKSKKKSLSDFEPPPPYEFLDTRLYM